MCGRYVPPDEAAMERTWQITRRNWPGWIMPVFNVAPTTIVPVILRGEDSALELIAARWGLIPNWWKKEAPPSLTFNARSEEAAQKPTWRQSLRNMRCLMPARGWYEWNENEPARSESGRKVNQPYFVHCPEVDVIAFAALWAVWERPGAGAIISCALLSKEAAPRIAGIHHRMPVVLKPEHYEAWLNPATASPQVSEMIADAREDLQGYRISTKVNSPRNDFPELLEPI